MYTSAFSHEYGLHIVRIQVQVWKMRLFGQYDNPGVCVSRVVLVARSHTMAHKATYLLGALEPRNRISYPLTQFLGMYSLLFLQFVCNTLQFWDRPCYAPPGDVLQSWVAFPVKPKMCIIVAFNEPIPTLHAIASPGLHRQRLVQVIFVARLLVGFLNLRLDGFGGGE